MNRESKLISEGVINPIRTTVSALQANCDSPMTESYEVLKEWIRHDKTSFHNFSDEEASGIQLALLDWYRSSRRKLPWRGDPGPYNGSVIGFTSVSKKDKGANKKTKQKSLTSYFDAKQSKQEEEQQKNDLKFDLSSDVEIYPARQVTPYGVWVSEIMLQQTRVEAVIPYYLKWMERFPTVNELALATEDEVNSYWAGLGFYRRARWLHAGAKVVVSDFNSQFPRNVEELMKIQGIGRYTASAIASIAYNVPVPVVDGNVCRVLSRLKCVTNHIKAPVFNNKLGWSLAEQIIKANGGTSSPGEVNQALMELGSTYCAPSGSGIDDGDPLREFYMSTKLGSEIAIAVRDKNVDNFIGMRGENFINCCELCDNKNIISVFSNIAEKLNNTGLDLNDSCKIAHRAFPLDPPKKEKREDIRSVAVFSFDIRGRRKWLMVKRPHEGLLAGQWEFPAVCVASEAGRVIQVSESLRNGAINTFMRHICFNAPNFVSEQDLLNTKSIEKAVKHIFSHVRHTSYIQHRTFQIENHFTSHTNTWLCENGKQEVRLMTETEMKDVGITAEIKKIISRVKESNKEEAKNKKEVECIPRRKKPYSR